MNDPNRTELTDLGEPRDGTLVRDDEGEGTTAEAPPFRAPAAPRPEPLPRHVMGLPAVGQQLHGFELLRVLGTGAFARVYLARQVSLNRLVALKVSLNQGQEARTLASLEHDHIVRVFSEVVDADRDLRLLCMQYVAGTTLERVIAALTRRPPEGRDGQAILAVIDEQATGAAALDLAALRDREVLAGLDPVEAGCWMGARLAEALAHAHNLGVLHRDIKPANVLVNRYGRPLLADFNISAAPKGEGDGAAMFGGTLAYMAPEHLDAFNPEDPTPPEAVDARSDVYSLGVMLFELFTGRLPFAGANASGRVADVLHLLAAERRAGPPALPAELGAPPALARCLARCLAPRPEDRFPSAAELAAALESCRELRRAERDLPPGRRVTRALLARPLLVACALILLPHLFGTFVNISYNHLRIVRSLDEAQQAAFGHVLVLYNAVFYPLGLFLFFRQFAPVYRTWRQLSRGGAVSTEEVESARRRALSLPEWGIAAAGIGWLPGGLLFPLGLDLLAGGVPWAVYGRFIFSFTVSGLIALTYSAIAVELVVLRLFYPGLWLEARQLRETARRELAGEEGRLGLLQFLAVLIPLAGASLMLGVGPESVESYGQFRLLVTTLLAAGMLGLGVAILAAGELRQVMAALTGTGHGRQ